MVSWLPVLAGGGQVRNIKEYNAKFIARKLNPENGHQFLPYIVVAFVDVESFVEPFVVVVVLVEPFVVVVLVDSS